MKWRHPVLTQILTCAFFFMPFFVLGQKNNNNNNNPSATALNNNNNNNNNNVNAPFDVGIGALIVTGIAFGFKKAFDRRKKATSIADVK